MKTISCKLSNTFKAADLVPNNQKFQDLRNEHDVCDKLETNAAALCKLLVEEKKSDLRIIYLCILPQTQNEKEKRKKKPGTELIIAICYSYQRNRN